MKDIVFDSGPIISLTTNNLLWLLDAFKERVNIYISSAVKRELVNKPLKTKRFKFEALQVLQYISKGTLNIINDKKIKSKANYLLTLANRLFFAKGRYMTLVHYADMETIAAAKFLNIKTVVIDERNSGSLIENPEKLAHILNKKLHIKIKLNTQNLKKFKEETSQIVPIRSVELVAVAFELGLLDKYIPKKEFKEIPDIRKTLLESVLWGVKIRGCAVSREEINDILKLEIPIPKGL